ncbi:MAG: hypothetical protein KA715_13605 [Xanthomonadaceae bacterium]|nr:hypothetical protein [Xanthomonadaceae bacterium]
MKFNLLVLSAVVSMASSSVMAAPYYVDSMNCVGKIQGDHSQVHPSYTWMITKFTSFLSKKKSGGYGVSLRIANDYSKTKSGLDKEPGAEVWYTSSLQLRNNVVTSPDSDFQFVIKKVLKGGHFLRGQYKPNNSVAGNGYWYDISCLSEVIDKPTRVSDQTKKD